MFGMQKMAALERVRVHCRKDRGALKHCESRGYDPWWAQKKPRDDYPWAFKFPNVLINRGAYFAPTSCCFFFSAMISSWMLPGTRRYLENSIVNVPCPCVMLRRSVE